MTRELYKKSGNINGQVCIKSEKLKGFYPQTNNYRELMTAGGNKFTLSQE